MRERDEPPLADDALLVRGGQFRVVHVLARAEACHRRLGFPGVSVAHAVTGLLVDLCEMSPRLLDYDECAVTTAGRIRRRFEIAATGAAPHHSIVLPAADLASVRALRDLFEVGIAYLPGRATGSLEVEVTAMTPDLWADYNQLDDDGYVVAYLEDIVRSERVVLGGTVIVADSEAKAHAAVVVGLSPAGTVALDVDWSSQPTTAPAGSATTA